MKFKIKIRYYKSKLRGIKNPKNIQKILIHVAQTEYKMMKDNKNLNNK